MRLLRFFAAISSAPSAVRRSAAFALLEVLCALVIATVLVIAAATALTTALHTEETALALQEATLVAQSVASGFYLGMAPTGAVVAGAEVWEVAYSEAVTGTTNAVAWRVLNLSPRSNPSLSVPLAFRTP